MRRRTFLAAAGASVVPLLTSCQFIGDESAPADIPQRKLDRLSIAGSTFRANFDNWQYSNPSVMPRLSFETYPAYVRDNFGVRKIELWERQFFPPGHPKDRYQAVRAAADAAGVSIVNVQVESLPSLNAGEPAQREEVLTGIKDWMDKAQILGAGSIRVNVTRQAGSVNLEAVIDILRRAAEYGRTIGVRVLVENHGGYTSSIPDMIELVRAVDDDFCRITIDWGEFTPPGDYYEVMQSAMPYVHIVSAKGDEFDSITLEHSSYDVARLVKNAEAGGFQGVYSIDFWGPNPPADTNEAMQKFIRTITDNMA